MPEPPLSILYVDDEPLLLNVTRMYLESLGVIVDTAPSGAEALEKISGSTFDAIVSDYQMPGMDGIALLKVIRGRDLDIPFILFTGRGREEVVIEAIESGADYYLQKGGKPVPQFAELLHKVRMAVERRRDAATLRESELRFRSLIQNSSDIIRIINKEGVIVYDSPSSSKILGYPEGSLIGLNPFEFIHPEDQGRVRDDFQEVCGESNSGIPTEYRIRKVDGSYLYVESLGLNLIGVPGIDGIVTTTHPIHSKKHAEDALRQANRQLHLLSGITRHDILNEVNVLQLLVEIIKQKIDVSRVHKEFQDLETVITTIQSQIEFTRVYQDLGTHEPQWQDLRAILTRVFSQGTMPFQIHLSGVVIFADPLLERVFYNLLDNSLRHGQTVTAIEVSEYMTSDALIIIYEDDGVGITAHEKEQIFDLGFGKSSGEGLFFIREILLITGITIQECGVEGKGSRFEIIVPKGGYQIQSNV